MYYVVVVLVLLVELHFVDLRTVRRSNRIALVLREIPIPHLVERTRHERHRRSATVNLDIHQILPINFNLHAYSLQADSRLVNIFRSFLLLFLGANLDFDLDNLQGVKKNRTKKSDFFFAKSA